MGLLNQQRKYFFGSKGSADRSKPELLEADQTIEHKIEQNSDLSIGDLKTIGFSNNKDYSTQITNKQIGILKSDQEIRVPKERLAGGMKLQRNNPFGVTSEQNLAEINSNNLKVKKSGSG